MTLKEATRACYKRGYNIYSWLNRFKKDAKLREDLPEEIYIKTCQDFITNKDKIKTPYPYFQAMMKKNSANYFSQQSGKKEEDTVNTNLLRSLGL